MAATGFWTLCGAGRAAAFGGRTTGGHTVARRRQFHRIRTWIAYLCMYESKKKKKKLNFLVTLVLRYASSIDQTNTNREYFEAFLQWRPVEELPSAGQTSAWILLRIAPWRRHNCTVRTAT